MVGDEELYILVLLLCIKGFNSMRYRSKLKRVALIDPHMSAWTRLIQRADDSSFTEITGMSRACFFTLKSIIFGNEINWNRGIGRKHVGWQL